MSRAFEGQQMDVAQPGSAQLGLGAGPAQDFWSWLLTGGLVGAVGVSEPTMFSLVGFCWPG